MLNKTKCEENPHRYFILFFSIYEWMRAMIVERKNGGEYREKRVVHRELGLRHYGTGITNTNAQSKYTNIHPGMKEAKACHP